MTCSSRDLTRSQVHTEALLAAIYLSYQVAIYLYMTMLSSVVPSKPHSLSFFMYADTKQIRSNYSTVCGGAYQDEGGIR